MATTIPLLQQFFDALKAEPEQVDEALSRITASIDRLTTAVNVHRNSSSPITMLPDDVLGSIFHEYAHSTRTIGSLEWTKLLLVSRVWYSVGIAETRLWAHITIRGRQGSPKKSMRRQIVNSGNYPLTLEWERFPSNNFFVVPDELWSHHARFKSLILSRLRPITESLLSQLELLPLPLLQHLDVQVDYEKESGSNAELAAPMVIPDYFLMLPSLRSLKIGDHVISWHLLRNLTKLSADFHRHSRVDINLQSIINALRQLPLLQKFQLQYYPKEYEEDIPCDAFSLPHLTKFGIISVEWVCCRFLRAFVLPSHCRILMTSHGISESADAAPLLSLLQTQFRRGDAPRIETVHVESYQFDQLFFHGKFVGADYGLDVDDSVAVLCHPTNHQEHTRLLLDIFVAIPCQFATILDARGAFMLSQDIWDNIWLSMPSLHTIKLQIDSETALNFFTLTRKKLEANLTGPTAVQIIDTLDITPGWRYWMDDAIPPCIPQHVDELIQLLEAYKEAGHPVKTLIIHQDDLFLSPKALVHVKSCVGILDQRSHRLFSR